MRHCLGGLLFAVLVSASPSFATGFSYGTLSWQRDTNFVSTTHARFEVRADIAVQRSWPWPSGANPNPGQTVTGFTLMLPSGAAYGIPMTVVAVNAAEDWMVLSGTQQLTLQLSQLPATLTLESCCRPNTLQGNNGGLTARVRTTLPAASTLRASPRATGLPRLYLARNTTTNLTLPSLPPPNETNSFTWATASESGLLTAFPSGMTLSSSGTLSWTPTTLGLYAVQARIVASDGTSVPYDFTVQVVPPGSVVTYGPGCGSTINTFVGREVSFDVSASSNLQSDVVTLTSSPLPTGATFTPVTTGPSPVSRFRWTLPRMVPNEGGSVHPTPGTTICFGAQSATASALGNCCYQLAFQPGPTRLVTGTLRDFFVSHADFAVPNGDDVQQLVHGTLGADGKPVFFPMSATSTVAGPASFNGWWRDTPGVPSRPVNFFMGQGTDAGVFHFGSTQFYPVDRGSGPDPDPNRNFTWELHESMRYQPGTVLGFASADDLWVFYNGQLVVDLGGVHSRQSFALSLTELAPQLGLAAGQSYPLDLFYAHRGLRDPLLEFDLADEAICEPTARSLSAADFQRFDAGVTSDGGIELQTTATLGATGAFALSPASVDNFVLEFDVRAQPSGPAGMEGFAVVLANAPGIAPNAERTVPLGPNSFQVVSDGGTLGYGGLPNSIAIEFDMGHQTTLNDPLAPHVAVMSRFVLPNSASHAEAQRGQLQPFNFHDCFWPYSSCAAPLPLTLGNTQRVRVEWKLQAGRTRGWLRVWIDAFNTGFYTPDLEVELEVADVLAAFPSGMAYVGFTTSASSSATVTNGGPPNIVSNARPLTVSNVKLATSWPTYFSTTQLPPPASAQVGQTVAARVQARNSCAEPMWQGGFASYFTATANRGATTVPVTVTDLGNGRYDFAYVPSEPGTWHLQVQVFGANIGGAPYTTTVSAVCGDGVTHAPELCDDGANNGAYGRCDATCTGPGPRCGDGLTQSSDETCDDSNVVSGDGCSSTCQAEVADAGSDAGSDDAGVDDAGFDAGIDDGGLADAGSDAGADDAGFDAGTADAGLDAGVDDAGAPDAGVDAGVADAGLDAGSAAGGGTGASGGGGGSDATPSGCGCGATGFEVGWLALALLGLARRRPRRA